MSSNPTRAPADPRNGQILIKSPHQTLHFQSHSQGPHPKANWCLPYLKTIRPN
ncbi:MAG: hypothetical protein AAF998_28960 [Bacteroidota bacterium]